MSFHPYSSKTGKLSYILYVSFSITALAFLSVPLVAVLPLSFSSDSFLSYPITGYSLQYPYNYTYIQLLYKYSPVLTLLVQPTLLQV